MSAHPSRTAAIAQAAVEEVQATGEACDLIGIIPAAEETGYAWNLVTDSLAWEGNARELLGVRSIDAISSGHEFQLLIAPEHCQRRLDVIGNRAVLASTEEVSKGIPYRVQYRFLPQGQRSDRSVWLDDQGRWWPDADGRPVKAQGVVRLVDDRYREELRVLFRPDHDELTGQLNRTRLTEALAAVIQRAERKRETCAFMIAAVNNLSVINETFGHDVGDEVIAAIARIIKEKLRGGDTIGRYSSNKFGIILNGCGPGAMRVAAERFLKAVREAAVRTSACQLSATISIGGVLVPDEAANVHHALSNALQALERARMKRYDCFMAYEPSAVRETVRQRNISIADEVISALDDDRMSLALQAIVTAGTHEPALYECLLRMERNDGSIVSAGEFIAVAEQLGLSRLIDRRVLELAVAVLRERGDIHLSLNVSALTAGDHDWIVALHRLTGGSRELTERLTIEITETAAIHDLDHSIAFVDNLKELGCRVAIDDFGAGYTSFKNLKLLDVDMVKIDGAFVRNLTADTTDRVFIKTMAELANTLGMRTVAEWVGDAATADILAGLGIDYLQGFHFGKPILPSELPTQGAAAAKGA